VEQAAGAGSYGLAVVDVDSPGDDHGIGSRCVGGAQDRSGVARIVGLDQDRDQLGVEKRIGERNVDTPADGDQALRGDRFRQRGCVLAADLGGVGCERRVPLDRLGRGEELLDGIGGQRLADRLGPLGKETPGLAPR
jgi:hypothetical protein